MFIRTINEKKWPQIYKRAIISLFPLLRLSHLMYHLPHTHNPTVRLMTSSSLIVVLNIP